MEGFHIGQVVKYGGGKFVVTMIDHATGTVDLDGIDAYGSRWWYRMRAADLRGRQVPAPPPTQAVEPLPTEDDAERRKLRSFYANRGYGHQAAPTESWTSETPLRAHVKARLIERKAVAAAYFAKANTTCTRCGGPAYTGLLHVECMAAKCESPAELEPDALELVSWHHVASNYPETGVAHPAAFSVAGWDTGVDEMVWCATGRGVTRAHPTIEGAAAAWREALRNAR